MKFYSKSNLTGRTELLTVYDKAEDFNNHTFYSEPPTITPITYISPELVIYLVKATQFHDWWRINYALCMKPTVELAVKDLIKFEPVPEDFKELLIENCNHLEVAKLTEILEAVNSSDYEYQT